MLHQAFLAEALENAAKLHEWNGTAAMAEFYRQKKEEIRAAVNEVFWNESEGCYLQFLPEEKQQRYELVQAAAAVAGLAEGERKERILDYLIDNPGIKRCSWYTMLYLVKALKSGAPRHRKALQKIIYDRYGFFAFNGATSPVTGFHHSAAPSARKVTLPENACCFIGVTKYQSAPSA